MKHVTLSSAGVLPVARFIVCGQSLGFRHIVRDELVTPVEMVMSVMTALIVLLGGGQALIP